MGVKGDKRSNDAGLSVESFIDRLTNISGITSKKMFGGYGVFHEGKMFGLVNSKGEIYLKSEESIQSKFEKSGSHQHGKMPYFSLPNEVFNDIETLISWVQESINISK